MILIAYKTKEYSRLFGCSSKVYALFHDEDSAITWLANRGSGRVTEFSVDDIGSEDYWECIKRGLNSTPFILDFNKY